MKNIIDGLLAVLTVLIPRLKKDDSVHCNKETLEVLIAANELGLFLISRFKDGVQTSDFTALYEKIVNDPIFKGQMLAAYDNYKLIPAEIEDLDAGEGLELVKLQVEYLPKILAEIKK